MTIQLVVRPIAVSDAVQAANWYESRQAGLKQRFLDETYSAFQRVARAPESYALAVQDIRCCRLPSFPYGIYFLIANEQVVVFAVYHFRRNPRKPKRRRSSEH
jgi:plasmid stabilization system protein ParE